MVLPWSATWVAGDAAIDGDEIVLAPGTVGTIDLYERDRDMRLVIDLASVETPDHARAFGRRYGLLTCGPGASAYREPLSDWKSIAARTTLILRLVIALRDDDVDQLRRLVAPFREQPAVEEVVGLHAKASVLVEGLVNHVLRAGDVREGVVAAVRITQDAIEGIHSGVRGPSPQWHFAPQFSTLAGFAYHRLAQAIAYRSPDLFACAHCSRITWRSRMDQRYCIDGPCADTAKKRRKRDRRATHAST